jgi:sensor histidine kinase regulating citrate/malate metabolism
MHDAVIGINENQVILFMNTIAKKILNLGEKQIIGKTVNELTNSSNLLKIILDNKNLADPLKVDLEGKISCFQQKNIEIVVPYIKLNTLDAVQYSAFSAGTIYILKDVT